MPEMTPATQQITTGDASKLVRLNNIYAAELSLLNEQELSSLVAEAFYAKCTTDFSAFLIAFDHSATYDSPNFIWFKNTTKRFAGNIGCMIQIAGGTQTPVFHTVELLDWATGGPAPEAFDHV